VVKNAPTSDSSVVASRPLEGRWPVSGEMDNNTILEFARQHANTWLKLDLLCFWSRYPHAKFTAGAIARAIGCKRRTDVEEALDSFVRDNLVDKHTDRALPFYCLTDDASKRECVLDIRAYRSSLRPALSMG
ncbi:MAG: hypothetical protein JW753_07590, partial [Dehalococcoidia bacterium]|nr:hypothetical protein [Dehalococcoidia bacterium]